MNRRIASISLGVALTALLVQRPASLLSAELPIRQVILFKHGVGYFERSAKMAPGETARLDFRAGDMNDVLKSLLLTDRQGAKIGGIRYDASEPLAERLADFPFALGANAPLSALLDQLKGARLELRMGTESVSGTIAGARWIKAGEQDRAGDRETVILMTDTGELRTLDLAAVSALKLADPKLQLQLKEYLGALSQAQSKNRRSVYIDAIGSSPQELVASYLTPAPVWKSSYRLLFAAQGEPTLEGWAIVDNLSGEDWNGVRLSVVSGRPISFVTSLYAPRWVERPTAELADNQAAAPRVFAGDIASSAAEPAAAPPSPRAMMNSAGALPVLSAPAPEPDEEEEHADVRRPRPSSLAATAEGRDAGALFEYRFDAPVTVKRGQSAMIPFLQQKIDGRRLLIYLTSFGVNPQNAAELTNTTGKVLDGGPITVYDGGTYAGEALVETVKAGDHRLVSYGVDLGTRITTAIGSSTSVVREVHLRRGILMTRVATQETKIYTAKNVDAQAKTLLIEHDLRPGYTLLAPAKAKETTATAYRFEVRLAPSANETLAVREEHVDDQTTSVTNMTPAVLVTWMQNKTLTSDAQRQLEQIAQKKRDMAANDSGLHQTDESLASLAQDQDRLRRNIDSLRSVAGQGEQVQRYAKQVAANEVKIAGLRDSQSELRHKKAALEADLAALIDKAQF